MRTKFHLMAFFLLCSFLSTAQTKSNKKKKGDTLYVNGDYVKGNKTVIYQGQSVAKKDQSLLLSKYIDTNQIIALKIGSSVAPIYKSDLKKEFSPFESFISFPYSKQYFSIRLEKGQLLINSTIYDFDGKLVGKMRDNKLSTNEHYELHATDRYIELFDEYNIPVLQIELDKETNCIYIGGAFNSPDGYMIVTQNNMMGSSLNDSKLYLSSSARDSLKNEYIDLARKIKPLHENGAETVDPDIFDITKEIDPYISLSNLPADSLPLMEIFPPPIIRKTNSRDSFLMSIGITDKKGFANRFIMQVRLAYQKNAQMVFDPPSKPYESSKSRFLYYNKKPLYVRFQMGPLIDPFYLVVILSYCDKNGIRHPNIHRVFYFNKAIDKPMKVVKSTKYLEIEQYLLHRNEW